LKVILIEDEPDSLDGMKTAVESIQEYEFELYTSGHADEALQLIEAERPDLIVTDIMLPGMTGLDLAERIVEPGYQPQVIVVSGYNDFEYARRSIRIGAADYLLKPYRTDEFVEKIRRSMSRIQEDNARKLEFRNQLSYAEIGTRSMRDEYLVDLCLKPTVLEEHLYHRLRLWGLEWLADGSYSVILMDTKGYPEGKPPGRDSALQTFAIGNIVREAMEEILPSILFKDPKHRWVLIMGSEDTEAMVSLLNGHVTRFHKIDLAIGRSSRKSAFEQIHTAYQEALTAFRIHSISADSESAEQLREEQTGEASWSPELMSAYIGSSDQDMIRQGVRGFLLDVLRRDATESREDITRGVLHYISLIHLELSKSMTSELEEIPITVWEKIDACQTLEEYEAVLGQYLVDLSKDNSAPRTNSIIERALRLIGERFADENLTLSLLAMELSIHPVWLSQSFKKETGKTYLDYVTDTRIESAKQLLRGTSQKIYEIAENVGYRDLQHFGHLFKKRTGQTPKEFRYGK
jgi:two-component system response regulator YesN